MIGQSVQFCQDTVSQDGRTIRTYPRCVTIDSTHRAYNAALCARVKRLREGRFRSAEEMALALGVGVEAYRKYETRTPLPHYLIERFALIVGRDIAYVVTGRVGESRLRIVESRKKPS